MVMKLRGAREPSSDQRLRAPAASCQGFGATKATAVEGEIQHSFFASKLRQPCDAHCRNARLAIINLAGHLLSTLARRRTALAFAWVAVT